MTQYLAPGSALQPNDALGIQSPAPAPRYNLFALISFISTFIVPVLGVVFGHAAIRQIDVTEEPGRGFARAGLILGYVFIGLTVVGLALYFVAIAAIATGISDIGGMY